MTATRLLELLVTAGIDYQLRDDGRILLRGPRPLLESLGPQLETVGRDAIVSEILSQRRASALRLAALLPHRFRSVA